MTMFKCLSRIAVVAFLSLGFGRAHAQTGCALDIGQFHRIALTSPKLIQLQEQLIDPKVIVGQQLIFDLAAEEARQVSPIRTGPEHLQHETVAIPGWNRELVGKYLDLLAVGLLQKQGDVRVESLYTVTEEQHLRGVPMSEAIHRCIQEAAAVIFPTLPFERQWLILSQENYALIKSPALASYLEQLYESLEQHSPSDPEFDRERDLRFQRTGLLERIYEADSDLGRKIIINEIVSELPRCDIEALRLLPDETLPGMDHVFSEQLPTVYEDSDWEEYNAKLGVIERYATAAVLPAMKKIFLNDPHNRNQYHMTLFLSYFLRTDPEYGRRLVEAALRNVETGASNVVLTELASVRLQPELREIAIQHLDDRDRDVAGNAAYAFKRIGIHGVESLLWERLDAWHKEWAGKTESIPFPEQSYQDGLVEALLFGRGRCESRETVEKLKRMYIKGNSVDGNIRFPEWREPVRIMFAPQTKERPVFIVDSCEGVLNPEEVKDAIATFPRKTEFEWHGSFDPVVELWLAPIRAEIERVIKQEGMSLRPTLKE